MRDNSLESAIVRLEKDLVDMKSPQPVGSSSIQVYETLTNFIWDFDYTMTSSDADIISGYRKVIGVTFTSRTQSAPFASLRFTAQVNGVRYNPLSSHNLYAGITTNPSGTYITLEEDRYSAGDLNEYAKDNTVRWIVRISSRLVNTNIKIKLIATATDVGIITTRDDTNIS